MLQKLGAIINLDDITHIDFLEQALGHIPGDHQLPLQSGRRSSRSSNDIMDNPGGCQVRHDQRAAVPRHL